MSRYDAVDDYVYPGTTVLRNKAGIQDQTALDAFEADATAVRMLELLEQPLECRFDFAHLCAITVICFRMCTTGLARFAPWISAVTPAGLPIWR